MKAFTCPYDYVHPPTGTHVRGTIEADTLRELREHMQAEMDASGGALTPLNFVVPGDLRPLVSAEPPFVPIEKLREANTRLRAAGLPEVKPLEAPVVVTK
jgi:hypothetical protein